MTQAQTTYAEPLPDRGMAIPYRPISEPGPWPYYSPEDIQSAASVLASGRVNYWTGGECRKFEQEYAASLGTRFAVALTNGTVALELALYALGVGPGDEVIVTPRSFIASASAVVVRRARPVFADVDRDSQNLTAATIAPLLTSKTKAIIAVHLAGWPCDMDSILDLARSARTRDGRPIAVIEDCAQAHGALYRGRPAGSMGDINAFSFCQDKIISTGGEGGLVATNDEELWRKAWSYKDHGKSYRAVYETVHSPGFRWLHDEIGTNWRMLEIQGVLGRRALTELEGWIGRRRANASRMESAFRHLSALRLVSPPAHIRHAYYKFYCYLRPEALRNGWDRNRVLAEINARGVPCFTGACGEMYREQAFSARGIGPSAPLPVARELGETSLVFNVHPTLEPGYLEHAAALAAEVIESATR